MDENRVVSDESTANRELVTSRIFDAPRERVFKAFSDPLHLAQWWGPTGFTNTFNQFEFRPSGAWRFVMHGPDGKSYPNESVFVEITAPERIVFRHISQPQFDMIITLAEHDSKTLLGWCQRFDSVDECRRIATFAIDANEQNLDRLALQLEKIP